MKLQEEADRLWADLQQTLNTIEELPGPLFDRLRAAIAASLKTITAINKLAAAHRFATAADEIAFFKTIKPPFLAEWLFYSRLYDIHLKWPFGTDEIRRSYLRKLAMQYRALFDQNCDFYVYCRSGGTDRDNKYFRRRKGLIRCFLPMDYYIESDEFTTGYDTLLASLTAFERLIDHLESLLAPFPGRSMQLPPASPATTLQWTNDKVDLVSLGYSLAESGAVNKGEAPVSHIISALCQAFNTKIKDPARKWIDIRARKSGKPGFIERLVDFFRRARDKSDGE